MKAARYREANQPLEIIDEPEPKALAGEIIVKVHAAGICATDAKIMLGKRPIKPGLVLGHEIAGEIVEVSSRNSAFECGNRVGVFPGLSCLTCLSCRREYKHLCDSKISLGLQIDGGFQQYMKVPAEMVEYGNVVILPPDISMKEATLLEPISCCLQALEVAPVRKGDRVLIIGAGCMGLLHVIVFNALGAGKIIISDPIKVRRERALQCGVSRVVDPRTEDIVAIVQEETEGAGVDVCYLCADDPLLLNQLCDTVRKRGTINIFSSSIKNIKSALDPNMLHYKEIMITGCHSSTLEYYKRSFIYFERFREQLRGLISGAYSIATINEAMYHYLTNQALKAIVCPNEL
jgi:L-iditol 2-dehydrogenase